MRIKIAGTAAEIEQAIAHLKSVYVIRADTGFYAHADHFSREIEVSMGENQTRYDSDKSTWGLSDRDQSLYELDQDWNNFVMSPEYYD